MEGKWKIQHVLFFFCVWRRKGDMCGVWGCEKRFDGVKDEECKEGRMFWMERVVLQQKGLILRYLVNYLLMMCYSSHFDLTKGINNKDRINGDTSHVYSEWSLANNIVVVGEHNFCIPTHCGFAVITDQICTGCDGRDLVVVIRVLVLQLIVDLIQK